MVRQYYIYIMTNKRNTVVYTGVTNDLKRRVYEHKEKLAEGFTKKYNIAKLVYYEVFEDVENAILREKQIKGGSRQKKIEKEGSAMENIKELRKRLDVDGLIKALSYSDWHVRRDATSALGKIVDRKTVSLLKKAVEPLIKTLKDEKAEVRSAAASALGTFVIYGIIDALDEKAKEAGEALEEALREALKDADKNIAWSLAVNLASIPVPVTLEREERLVRRIEHAEFEGFHSGLLLLTNRRLIYNEAHFDGSFSYELPLEDIASCEVKGKEKLVVVSRHAVVKQRPQLVTEGDMWRYEEARILEAEPKPLGFKGIKQPETLRSEIMEQVEIYKKASSQK